MATKRMKYKKAGVKKKNLGGPQMANPPAASFLEPPVEQPFSNNPGIQAQNPAEFTAKEGGKRKANGGVRELRKKQRQERRADRKADRQAIRELKKSSRKTRKAKPFKDGAGPIVEMTRAEKRADRKATRKASRTFRKQERKARRSDRKEDRQERRNLRATNKQAKKDAQKALVDKKLNTLNKSESSSVNKPFIGPKNKPTEDKKVVKNETTKKTKSIDDMSFSEAYRTQRDANKKAGIAHYGDDRGYFTWRGKEYNTESASEKKKRKGSSEKATTKKEKSTDIKGGKDVDGDGLNDDITGTTSQTRPKTKTTQPKTQTKKKIDYTAYPGSCFSAGTLIETANGQIPIEMIKIDDEVKSYNTKTKEIELAKVDELFVHEDCGDGLILNGSIKTTTNHPFYVDGKWVEAGDLKMGDEILHVDGLKHKITSMEINADKQTVYNFEVPGHHNYFAEGYLVHNKQRYGGYRRRGGKR